jgi:hypothetical protein
MFSQSVGISMSPARLRCAILNSVSLPLVIERRHEHAFAGDVWTIALGTPLNLPPLRLVSSGDHVIAIRRSMPQIVLAPGVLLEPKAASPAGPERDKRLDPAAKRSRPQAILA